MIPLYQHILGITSLTLLVVGRLLWLSPRFRRWARPRLERAGTRLLALVNPEPDLDPFAEELYRVLRLERLEADLQRLRRLLATDMAMSATRQLGNRLAYDWLLREYDRVQREEPVEPRRERTVAASRVTSAPLAAVSTAATPSPVRRDLGQNWQRPPTVEVLDIGWRS